MKVYEVEWLDASSSTDETSLKRAQKNRPIVTFTIGYLMAENDECITLVTDRWPKSPKRGKAEHIIPHGMIINKWEWRDE